MGGDSPPIRGAACHDDPARDQHTGRHGPSMIAGDPGRKPPLPIDGPDQLVQIGDVGLQLDDEQHPPTCVIREHVDDASLTKDRERDLGPRHPARQAGESAAHGLVKTRMSVIEQTVEVACPPARDDIEPDVEGRGVTSRGIEAQRPEMASLDPRYGRLRDAGQPGDVGLAQATTDPDLAEGGAESLVVHGRTLTPGPHRRLTQVSTTDQMFYCGVTRLSTADRGLPTRTDPPVHR